MRITVVTCGSRGDVQPMLALAVGCGAAGHEVTVCSSADNGDWARSLGCAFEAVGEPLRDNPALGGWGVRPFNRFVRRQLSLQVRDLPRIIAGSDMVVASGLAWGVRPVAEHLGVPYRYVSFTPVGLLGTTRDPVRMRLLRAVADRSADLFYGRALNRGRSRLGLPPTRHVMAQLMGPATIAATDPALTVLPRGARPRVVQTGYPLLATSGELNERLQRFLAAGPPPIYAGFGSMPYGGRERVSKLLVEAAERAGQRIVIYRGWARIPELGHSDDCLFVDEEPHGVLFPRVAAVVHHGGAGTVATAARAGVPQIVLPQAADQFLWRSQVVRLGLGPRAPMLRFASAASVARAIAAALADPGYRRRAQNVAARLQAAPDGVATTVAEITRRTVVGV
jgi:vancomycin aglycone glucosyltransferase